MKHKLKILYNTAGGKAKNTELGMGHTYRCINLADCMITIGAGIALFHAFTKTKNNPLDKKEGLL